MGLILSICGGAAAIVSAAVVKAFADDLKEWTPLACHWLADRAVRRLPELQRARLGEEWQAGVQESPGVIAKVVYALGLSLASFRLEAEHNRVRRAWVDQLLIATAELAATMNDLTVRAGTVPREETLLGIADMHRNSSLVAMLEKRPPWLPQPDASAQRGLAEMRDAADRIRDYVASQRPETRLDLGHAMGTHAGHSKPSKA